MAGGPAPCTVLVVDDDVRIRNVLATLLERDGLRVMLASDGEDAIRLLATIDVPCAIVLDLDMPRMGGTEFSRALRRSAATAAVPLIVVSGSATIERHASDIGAVAWLPKPFDFDLLRQLVGRYCPGGARLATGPE